MLDESINSNQENTSPIDSEIVASIATFPLKETLSYLVPAELESTISIGSCVKIPLGRRSSTGYVIDLIPRNKIKDVNFAIKAVISAVKDYPIILHEQIEWFKWIANYYSSSLAAVLDTAIPAFTADNKTELIINLNNKAGAPRGLKARNILEYLSQQKLPLDIRLIQKQFPNSAATIRKLKQSKYILTEFTDDQSVQDPQLNGKTDNLTLTEQQKFAANKIIQSKGFSTFLLHGVTGSGKTEVYLQAAQHVLSQGKGVLILVPEISLTPQLIERFSSRLNQPIAVLHSAVKKNSRWLAWKNLLNGKFRVCLGARSAVFAPIKDLGLILVDEEHDGSFKQSEGIRYNGRDLAVMRAKFARCPAVLGSATPSLESLSNAQQSRYQYLSLPNRPLSRTKASIQIVDLNKVPLKKMASKTISPVLLDALRENLDKGEQSFLLYNRRGFASYLQCQCCSQAAYCPNCSVSFTYHSSKNSLVCHYCGLSQIVPKYCSSCKLPEQITDLQEKDIPLMVERGAGTEKAMEEIMQLFPQAKIERLDRDSVSSTEELVKILNKVRSNECQILVGTQMIAKGHDIPNVTLVGVLDSDIGLHMPDFRASERVFNLITQVAGRAGRGELAGKVILQTRLPGHPVIQYAAEDNYAGFANYELEKRQELNYPPFGKLLRIVISHNDSATARHAADSIAQIIFNQSENFNNPTCLGPAQCPIERLRGLYRFHIILKNKSSAALSSIVKYLKEISDKICKGKYKDLRITYDLDPLDML